MAVGVSVREKQNASNGMNFVRNKWVGLTGTASVCSADAGGWGEYLR